MEQNIRSNKLLTEQQILEELGIDSCKDLGSENEEGLSKRFINMIEERKHLKIKEEVKYSSESSRSSSSQSFSFRHKKSEESMQTPKKEDNLKFLDLCPPNFEMAEIHGSASKVKDLDQVFEKRVEKLKKDPEYYCP